MYGWKIIPYIELKEISYGSAENIWGINPAGEIFQFSDGEWNRIQGPALNWVSVGSDGTVWGVTKDYKIFRRDGDIWQPIKGGLAQISVGSASEVWGVNKLQKIFKYSDDDSTPWVSIPGPFMGITPVPGGLKYVSVGSDGTVWGVNPLDLIFRRVGNKWKRINGLLTQISVGSASEVWGVNKNHSVFKYSGNDSTPWIGVPGRLGNVSVGSDGMVWGIENTQVWHYLKNFLLLVSAPYLKEERLEQGDNAKFAFSVTNISNGVIVEDVELELLYDVDDFKGSGITISPSPPDKIQVPSQLETGIPVEVEFKITAEQDAKIKTYGFEGVHATYNIKPTVQPESLPINNNNEGMLSFKVVKD